MAKKKEKTKNPSSGQGRYGAMDSFFKWEGDILIVNILGTPSSKRDAIGKVKGLQLKVSVTAEPKAGRATDHMVKYLAKEFGVSSSAIEVVFGRMNVNKQLRIKDPKKLPSVFLEPTIAI